MDDGKFRLETKWIYHGMIYSKRRVLNQDDVVVHIGPPYNDLY